MTAIIKVGNTTAMVDNMAWTASAEPLDLAIKTVMLGYEVSGSDPNPDQTAAQFVADELGGQVVSFDPVDFDPERVY